MQRVGYYCSLQRGAALCRLGRAFRRCDVGVRAAGSTTAGKTEAAIKQALMGDEIIASLSAKTTDRQVPQSLASQLISGSVVDRLTAIQAENALANKTKHKRRTTDKRSRKAGRDDGNNVKTTSRKAVHDDGNNVKTTATTTATTTTMQQQQVHAPLSQKTKSKRRRRKQQAKISTQYKKKVPQQQAKENAVRQLEQNLVNSSAYAQFDQSEIVDVYNFCARYDTLPQIEIKRISFAKRKSYTLCTVSLPSQDIVGVVKIRDKNNALKCACVEFKKHAQTKHTTMGQESLVLNDCTQLTVDNVTQFFDYYRTITKTSTKPSVNSSVNPDSSRTFWRASVSLGDLTFPDIVLPGKKLTEQVAWLAAGLSLKKKNSEIFEDFLNLLRKGPVKQLKLVGPYESSLQYDAIRSVQQTTAMINDSLESSCNDNNYDSHSAETLEHSYLANLPTQHGSYFSNRKNIEHRSIELERQQFEFETTETLEHLRTSKESLPVRKHTDELLSMINSSSVCVVIGATGSGKTTQLPQMIFENAIRQEQGGQCNIICTQPRRIAATSVARRVASERNENLEDSVGYGVRFDKKTAKLGGSINYVTTGILLNQLQHSDPSVALAGISHIIVDEVHERDIQIDFLLTLLKRILKARSTNGFSDLKIVLMSATIDTNLFRNYFQEVVGANIPYIEIPGRTFPVTQHFLDDYSSDLLQKYSEEAPQLVRSKDVSSYMNYELTYNYYNNKKTIDLEQTQNEKPIGVKSIDWSGKLRYDEEGSFQVMSSEESIMPYEMMSLLLGHILKTTDEGAILVFLPGLQEITKLKEMLTRVPLLGVDLNDTTKYRIFTLHSAIPHMQEEVFEKLESGVRKVILSTNIAETSVTIPEVVYVVDSGKHREKHYDQVRRVTTLTATWVSKSSAKQRSGRAGRVSSGHYYTLMSRARHESLPSSGTPELLRSDLQITCLAIRAMGMTEPIAEVLSECIEPPTSRAVESALTCLKSLKALDGNERLTNLGSVLSKMPLEPSLGRMVLLGAIYKCLDPILIIAATSTARDPFLSPSGTSRAKGEVKKKFAGNLASDHLALVNAFKEWRMIFKDSAYDAASNFAISNHLHKGALSTIHKASLQIYDILLENSVVSACPRNKQYNHELGTPDLNANSDNEVLVKAILAAGLYPNIAARYSRTFLRTKTEEKAIVHATSVNYLKFLPSRQMSRQSEGTDSLTNRLIAFTSKSTSDPDSSMVMLRHTSEVSPLGAILFTGNMQLNGSIITVDDWLRLYSRGSGAPTIVEFSEAINRYFDTLCNSFRCNSFRHGKNQRALAVLETTDYLRDEVVQRVIDILYHAQDNDRTGTRNIKKIP